MLCFRGPSMLWAAVSAFGNGQRSLTAKREHAGTNEYCVFAGSARDGRVAGMSEANRDEATKCLNIAQRAIAAGDLDKARKFCEKAQQLYPSPQVRMF